jgi:hypothetical protein
MAGPDEEYGPKVEGRCNAKRVHSRRRCNHQAGYGTNHVGFGPCKYHYGSTPQVVRGAFTQMARKMAVSMGQPADTDPFKALTGELARTAGHVAWLEQRVQSFPIETGPDAVLTEAQQHWYAVYVTERKHLIEVSRIAIGAGLVREQVRLAQEQGKLLALAVERILAGLELSTEQQDKVPQLVPAILRSLPALEAG